MTPDNQPALPELPKPFKRELHWDGETVAEYFTADQMRAYALESLRRAEGAKPAGITAEWVLGYLQSDVDQLTRSDIEYAFSEWAALNRADGATLGDELASWRELADHVRTGVPIWPGRYTDSRTRDVAQFIREHSEGATLGERGGCVIRLAVDDWNPYELLDVARLYVQQGIKTEGDGLLLERIVECLKQQKLCQIATPTAQRVAYTKEDVGEIERAAYRDGYFSARREDGMTPAQIAKAWETFNAGNTAQRAAAVDDSHVTVTAEWYGRALECLRASDVTPPPTGEAVACFRIHSNMGSWGWVDGLPDDDSAKECAEMGWRIEYAYTHPAAQAEGRVINDAMVERFATVWWRKNWPFKPDNEANRELMSEFRKTIRKGLAAALTAPADVGGEPNQRKE